MWKVVYAVQIQCRESRMLLTNGQHPLCFLVAAIAGCIYIKFHHQGNNRSKYADGFHNSMIDDKDGHIPLPLFMFTCTALRHDPVEWPKNKGVHPKASKSKLKLDRPDCSNYFNYKNDGGKNASGCAATDCKLLTSPGVADTYAFLMNTWNTLPESYQQRVYEIGPATVRCQIQQADNPTPAEVISVEAAPVDNAIYLDYLTSEIGLEEPEIGSTDPKHRDGQQMQERRTAFQDARGQRGLPWGRWRKRQSRCHGRRQLATTAHDWTREVLPGNQWSWCVWGGQWRWCGCEWGGRRIASWWWINAEWGGRRALYHRGWRFDMAMMRMRMRRMKHHKPMMDQHRMWRTEGIVLESVKIG